MPTQKRWVVDEKGFHAVSEFVPAPSNNTTQNTDDENSANNQATECTVQLQEGKWLPGDDGFQFNKKCFLQVKGRYLKETTCKKVTFDTFIEFEGEEEDLCQQVEAFLNDECVAEAEVMLFYGGKYSEAIHDNPDARCTYKFKAHNNACKSDVESELLEMPEEEENQAGDINIDFDFISEREGGCHTEGYIPQAGQSGVTIGTGIDLGQWDATGLQNMGVNQELIDLFEPYFGLTRDEAEEYLNNNPLTITEEQAAELDEIFMQNYFQPLIDGYNAASEVNFEDIETEAQTVIASVAYQYGTDLASATPNFWQQVTTQDWQAGVDNLRDFGDDYQTRRDIEADLLDDLLVEE